MECLRSPSAEAAVAAASALANLARVSVPNKEAIVAAGAIPALVKLLAIDHRASHQHQAGRCTVYFFQLNLMVMLMLMLLLSTLPPPPAAS